LFIVSGAVIVVISLCWHKVMADFSAILQTQDKCPEFPIAWRNGRHALVRD